MLYDIDWPTFEAHRDQPDRLVGAGGRGGTASLLLMVFCDFRCGL